LARGAAHGLANPIFGGAQIGARMQEPNYFAPTPDEGLVKTVDTAAQERQQQFQADPRTKAHPTATAIGEIGGEAVSPPNLALAAIPGGGVAKAALTGAASAAMAPTAGDDFWSDKKRQIALGLVGGGVGGGAANIAGKVIAPPMRAAAQKLRDAGVSITPGQMIGGVARRAEEAAKSFPILGSFIRGAEGRGFESFNRAVINQALEPIGKSLPKDLEGGARGQVSYAAHALDAAYDRILPKMTFREDPGVIADLDSLRTLVKEMPAAQVEQFSNILQNRLAQRLGSQGNMDGQTLNQVWSELGNLASTYRTSSDAAQRQLGTALEETRSIIHQALTRQNPPELVKELENTRAAYAMLARIETAANRRAGSSGFFSPLDLLSAIRSGDRTVRHRAFSHGDALMQKFAQAGQDVLSSKLPDSGTPERAGWMALEGLGLLAGGSRFPWETAAAGSVATLPYTKIGSDVVARYLSPGARRRGIGQGFSDLDAVLGVPGGIIAGRQ
jgi:hypothetical protein